MVKFAEDRIEELVRAVRARRDLPEYKGEDPTESVKQILDDHHIPVSARSAVSQTVENKLWEKKLAEMQAKLPPELQEKTEHRAVRVRPRSQPSEPENLPKDSSQTEADKARREEYLQKRWGWLNK